MKILTAFLLLPLFCFAEELYFNNGKSLDAKILEANETHATLQRATDLQQFRIKIDMLTKDTQKQIELYHSKDRYSSIPSANTPLDQRTLSNYTKYIDELIDQNLRSKRLSKTKDLDDAAYVRRLYLTVIGRIPTQSELEDFFNDRDSDKKDKLIQNLLNSEGYVNHQMNWWSDMLRIKDRINGANINVGGVYREWLRNSIRENKPYDQIVRELVSSSGRIFENKESAAVSYFFKGQRDARR